MSDKLDISVVVPLYNEIESIPELCDWIQRVMNQHQFNYEILLIDDGSTDGSWDSIQQLSQANGHIKGIQFNRNYGKSAALNIGFQNSSGRVVITMDADLQDSPEEIPGLYRMIDEDGFDLVSGWKKKRHDPLSKTIPSRFFNYVTRKISGIKLHDFNCGLKAYSQRVIKSIDVYGEMHRYIPLIAKWQGFTNISEKTVTHRPRKYGITKFGLERFIFGFLDLLSLTFVTKFKKRPMHFFGTLGILSFVVGLAITIWLISEKLYFNLYLNQQVRSVVDQPLFFLALVALIIGVQLFLSGFLAEILTLNSPHKNDYTISHKIGFD